MLYWPDTRLMSSCEYAFSGEHIGATIFQTLIIYDLAFDGVVLRNLIHPFTELYRTLRIDLKPYGINHLYFQYVTL